MSVSSYPAGSAGQPDRVAMSDLLRELFGKMSDIIQTQLQLAKTEIKASSQKMLTAVFFASLSLILGSMGIFFFGLTVLFALWQVLSLVWATFITTGIFLGLTAVAILLLSRNLHQNSADIEVDLG